MYEHILLRIKDITGIFYTSGKTDTIVIYGIGAPILPDNGNLHDASTILSYKTDIFVPDYIGYGRSEGIFTPENCVKTFLHLFENFTKGCTGTNSYTKLNKKLRYKRIIFIGRSFGGAYIPLLPRFNRDIKELAIFCPVVESKSCGSVAGEETNEDFMNAMRHDGYKNLYRGILDKIWSQHLENRDDFSPMDNIKYLSNAKLFIGHGKKDLCVHYSKSEKYYRRIRKMFPERKDQFLLKLYINGAHDPTTTNPASTDFLDWLQVSKRKQPHQLEM